MYAIFRALGKQFRAEKGKTLRLPLMNAAAGSKVTFDEVLLSSNGETIKAGAPAGQGRLGRGRSGGRGEGAQDLRLQVQAAEELPPQDRASAEVHRGPHHRSEAGLRQHMAHKKGVGSSRNGRTSNPKYLGVKRYGGEQVDRRQHPGPAAGHQVPRRQERPARERRHPVRAGRRRRQVRVQGQGPAEGLGLPAPRPRPS